MRQSLNWIRGKRRRNSGGSRILASIWILYFWERTRSPASVQQWRGRRESGEGEINTDPTRGPDDSPDRSDCLIPLQTALCLGIKVVSRAKREKTAAYTIQVSLTIRHKTSTKRCKCRNIYIKKLQSVSYSQLIGSSAACLSFCDLRKKPAGERASERERERDAPLTFNRIVTLRGWEPGH